MPVLERIRSQKPRNVASLSISFGVNPQHTYFPARAAFLSSSTVVMPRATVRRPDFASGKRAEPFSSSIKDHSKPKTSPRRMAVKNISLAAKTHPGSSEPSASTNASQDPNFLSSSSVGTRSRFCSGNGEMPRAGFCSSNSQSPDASESNFLKTRESPIRFDRGIRHRFVPRGDIGACERLQSCLPEPGPNLSFDEALG